MLAISKIDNWEYNAEEDTWTGAAEKQLLFHRVSKERTESGYEIEYRHDRSHSCEDCPLKSKCTKAKGNREIRVIMNYMRLKEQARDLLRSEEGYTLAVRKMIELESVFGQMKNNRGFRRLLLLYLQKVSIEVGRLSLAHNLLKKELAPQVENLLLGQPQHKKRYGVKRCCYSFSFFRELAEGLDLSVWMRCLLANLVCIITTIFRNRHQAILLCFPIITHRIRILNQIQSKQRQNE